jgi:hypothetical protein
MKKASCKVPLRAAVQEPLIGIDTRCGPPRKAVRRDDARSTQKLCLLRLRELARLICFRHGRLPAGPVGKRYLALAAQHCCTVDELSEWARSCGASLPSDALTGFMRDAKARPRKYSADALAKQLELRHAERSLHSIRTIGAVDMPKAERKRRRAQRDRARSIERRRANGAKPREQYIAASLSRRKPWLEEKPPVSRATWYRRSSVRQVRPPYLSSLIAGAPVSRSTRRGPRGGRARHDPWHGAVLHHEPGTLPEQHHRHDEDGAHRNHYAAATADVERTNPAERRTDPCRRKAEL